MPPQPSLGVVVCTYNHFDYAARTLQTAYLNAREAEVRLLVADDASPDFDPDWVARVAQDAPLDVHRFATRGGLIRSWNEGLRWAKDHSLDYVCLANSDLYFPPGWDVSLVTAADKHALVGPLTNAPGTEKDQWVGKYAPGYDRTRIDLDADKIARHLHAVYPDAQVDSPVNGFCLFARTSSWWDTAYGLANGNVFRPANFYNSKGQPNPDPYNCLGEYEYQGRLRAKGLSTAVVPGSYVVHYRSVTRGPAHLKGDWVRPSS